MVRINIICVNKPREKYIQMGLDEFCKRLSPYAKVEIVEVGAEKVSSKAQDLDEMAIKRRRQSDSCAGSALAPMFLFLI